MCIWCHPVGGWRCKRDSAAFAKFKWRIFKTCLWPHGVQFQGNVCVKVWNREGKPVERRYQHRFGGFSENYVILWLDESHNMSVIKQLPTLSPLSFQDKLVVDLWYARFISPIWHSTCWGSFLQTLKRFQPLDIFFDILLSLLALLLSLKQTLVCRVNVPKHTVFPLYTFCGGAQDNRHEFCRFNITGERQI